MSDNVTLNAGTGGDVIAADDIGPGVKYQRVKVVLGADGTNDGDVASGNPLPVSGTVTANLAAGTNNIGDVDVLSIAAGDNNIGNVDVVTLPGSLAGVADNGGFTDGTTPVLPAGYIYDEVAGTALTENDVGAARMDAKRAIVSVIEDGTTRGLKAGVVDETGASAVDAVAVGGGTPHDSVDSGNPVLLGARAVSHGANPTAVAAADRTRLYANRAGILFTIGGHPNTVTASVRIADATGAQTDAAISPGTISTGTKIAVTAIAVTCSAANTVNVAVKVGFGPSTLPADSTTGAVGVLLDHEGIAPGSGVVVGNGSGILGVGGDGEELRLTCDDPVGGFVCVTYSYFTIES